MPGTEDTAQILREVLDEWKAGVDAHDPGRVAAVFTADAIFQGLHPHSVGRQGVFDYYESQPVGLTVDYSFHETRRPADDAALGYLRADFTRPDGEVIPLNLSVLATRGKDGWRIAFYQVSSAQG
ncbi:MULTISPECIES: SgcJ/EcaC family oxidoreductase [unclassified Mycolicibacterium]|uniref:YybH family protein n=1 Tax=unclassified Mycolicibacterium TaxID=2636767 RepID=UPI00130A6A70|nr:MULTISPECIES: SgcJ/EcaC family oxidoreductase [unclassified Mycolicibacterium]MUL85789.1 SgcJ/EcaC family oxidoreductase [Mycolicibacterium sp. CBMA 329]MUL90159.1 SgcJ/EcaC family oxidoreductase [Mycolicibacterium sp. CBMA 331]MUM00928.1 SgcJ/EcaC family oxidoreductase [Mycolicibacterium sp. CBMA 334]MUM27468.1 SgcJ/EcaC family oxidoreductase [Mycolicibacterium sp. CBMA 295]MUM39674.1 SgcJ/EcaC family oxidoreductase [Mycolicibacterium sp. CBMA 247]